MNVLRILTLLLLPALLGVQAQDDRVTLEESEIQHLRSAPLPEVEKELAQMGHTVLRHDITQYKDYMNARFLQSLGIVLQRADSYNYPFDSLVTVSRIYPADNTFRIFTWALVDQDSLQRYQNYHHFGLVQRPRIVKGKTEYHVIPLTDRMDRTPTIESDVLSPGRWLGALYYKPRDSQYGVMTYKGTFLKKDGLTGKKRTYKATYYVLLGYNGHDRRNNYKIIDCITFPNAENPLEIQFGAPIFYFGEIPKSRAVFKYSDNTSFSLNKGFIKDPKGGKKNEALVFDHLESVYRGEGDTTGVALLAEKKYGPNGTYDALVWLNKVNDNRKGFLYLLKDVDVYHPEMEAMDPEEARRRAEEERKKLKEARIIK